MLLSKKRGPPTTLAAKIPFFESFIGSFAQSINSLNMSIVQKNATSYQNELIFWRHKRKLVGHGAVFRALCPFKRQCHCASNGLLGLSLNGIAKLEFCGKVPF